MATGPGGAGSASTPELPITFRPWRARWMLGGLAVAIVISMAVVAVILPSPGRTTSGFSTTDRLGFAVLALLFLAGLALLARPCVKADAVGLLIVNVGRTRRVAWAEIFAVRLRPGDAWLVLELTDGSMINAMGVQTADGARATEVASQIARLVTMHGTA